MKAHHFKIGALLFTFGVMIWQSQATSRDHYEYVKKIKLGIFEHVVHQCEKQTKHPELHPQCDLIINASRNYLKDTIATEEFEQISTEAREKLSQALHGRYYELSTDVRTRRPHPPSLSRSASLAPL